MKLYPHALKTLLLAGQALALLMSIPQVFVGVRIYNALAHVLFTDLSLTTICEEIDPTSIIVTTLNLNDDKLCLVTSMDTNVTALQDECNSKILARCDVVSLFEWLGFILRPIRFGRQMLRYFSHARFLNLESPCGERLQLALGRVGAMDFVMFSLMDGDIQDPLSLLTTFSFIAYLRFATELLLNLDAGVLLQIFLGLMHCAACAEALLILGMGIIMLHRGVSRHGRILGIFSWKLYAKFLTPLSFSFVALQLGLYAVLSVIHIFTLRWDGKHLYLICVLGYPMSTLAVALLNSAHAQRSAKVSSFNDRTERICGLVDSMCSTFAEDLLFALDFEPTRLTARIGNYDLLRLCALHSQGRMRWTKNDQRSAHILRDAAARGVAYIENGVVLVQLNDAALLSTKMRPVYFDVPVAKRARGATMTETSITSRFYDEEEEDETKQG